MPTANCGVTIAGIEHVNSNLKTTRLAVAIDALRITRRGAYTWFGLPSAE